MSDLRGAIRIAHIVSLVRRYMAGEVEFAANSGIVKATSLAAAHIDASVGSGTISLGIKGTRHDYNLTCNVNSGTSKVDGTKFEGSDQYSSRQKSLTISVNSGTSNVKFST